MTLDRLIEHEENESKATWNGKATVCAEEHRQLAEWLKDYKRLLEQEHCEDAISRQAAIRIAEQGQIQGYEWQFKELNKLPPVTPKQRTGRWVSYPHQKDRECSICGHSEPYKFADKEAEIFNYCPNCGAKMAESEG